MISTDVLRRDNPELLRLEDEYRKLNLFPNSAWEKFSAHIDMQAFRGEGQYLAQMWGGMTETRYWNSYEHCRKNADEVIEALDEDSAFGCVTFERDVTDRVISRDLIDSALEIQFLNETLGWHDEQTVALLDIGSGYGRFAHRFVQYNDVASIECVDAVPVSTFLCDFYLNYRKYWTYDFGSEGSSYDMKRAWTVPLHKLSTISHPIDLACNMYSFGEMPLSAVNSWLDFCTDLKVPYFFLVPHAGNLVDAHFVTTESDGSHENYFPAFIRHGYEVIAHQHKFPRDESERYIYNTEYFLFRRQA